MYLSQQKIVVIDSQYMCGAIIWPAVLKECETGIKFGQYQVRATICLMCWPSKKRPSHFKVNSLSLHESVNYTVG